MNDNQNAFVKRPTSRVLAAPGGKSSMGAIFGGGMSATTNTKNDTSKKLPPKEEAEVFNNNNTAANDNNNKEEEATTNNSVLQKKEEEESAISAAARIKQKNESQHFTLFPGGSNNVTQDTKVSSNAFASAATTNSYNVLTDRPTSRVVSVMFNCCFCVVKCFFCL